MTSATDTTMTLASGRSNKAKARRPRPLPDAFSAMRSFPVPAPRSAADRARVRDDLRVLAAAFIAGLGLEIGVDAALSNEFEAGVDVAQPDEHARHLPR